MTTTTTALPNTPGIPTEGALAGLKVLDLMWVVAGPTATRAMADFGATVVRVESANRIETARGIGPYHNNGQGPDHSGLFGNMNINKLGLSLNLGTAEGRDVLLDLIKWCDVLTESFSPRAMRAWGMDYDSLHQIRPDLIMLSTCLFGQEGPLSRVAGFGTMGAAIGGYIALAGNPGGAPIGPYSAYTDYLSPRFALPTILAALDHRDRTGEGIYIDQAQAESSLHFMSTALLDYTINGRVPQLVGNADPDMAPHGCYAASGDDDWVAIAVRDDADWANLCAAMGMGELTCDDRFADLAARKTNEDELNGIISGLDRRTRRGRDRVHAPGLRRARSRRLQQLRRRTGPATPAPRPLRRDGTPRTRDHHLRGRQGPDVRDPALLSLGRPINRPR